MRILSVVVTVSALLLAGFFSFVRTSQATPTFIYSSPRPGAVLVSPGTTVTVRYARRADPAAVSRALFDVWGEESGFHGGDVILAGDGRTVIFSPDDPFTLGERVTATIGTLRAIDGSPLAGGDLTFTVAAHPVPITTDLLPEMQVGAMPTHRVPLTTTRDYVTVPDSFPTISVTTPASGTADGYLFLAPFTIGDGHFGGDEPPYLLILDDQGEPVFYRELPAGETAFDFKRQPGGELTYVLTESGFHVLDETYTEVAVYTAGNGYKHDIHDFQLRPDGRALLMIYDGQIVDMSEIVEGGDPQALVIGLVIQEVDADNNVLFQWRSWDHIPITDTTSSLTRSRIDYVHGNSLQWDLDGNIILSSRFLDEITKIDRDTGEIIWRLGGKANQFTFVGEGEPFFDQHDARRLLDGHLTVFDNRTGPNSTYSRAVEYELDEQAMIARRVWERRSEGDSASIAMGDVQRLPNGNTLIGWGALATALTEVTPGGQKAFELVIAPDPDSGRLPVSYRAFRFAWEGLPVTRPQLVARTETTGTGVYYSWNGATNVDAWLLYAGSTPGDLHLVDAQIRDGFEARSSISDSDLCFFQARALDANGVLLGSSPIGIAGHCVVDRVFMPLAFRTQ